MTSAYDDVPFGAIDPDYPDAQAEEEVDAARLEVTAEEDRERRIASEMEGMAVRDEAQRRYRAQRASRIEIPPVQPLDAFLARDLPHEKFLIDGVWPTNGNVMFAAQRKAGKTSVVHNLIRSLVDTEPFLDAFDVLDERKVLVLDVELSEPMLQRWLRDQGIESQDRLSVVSLRGRAESFRITDDNVRALWARIIQDAGANVLILDPLRPIMAALGLNEWNEGGTFLAAWDALCKDAGITESLIAQHHGHHHERALGDSRFVGWSDVNWDLTRTDMEDPRSDRFFRAFGRDVDVAEGLVRMDESRHLSYEGATRKQARAFSVRESVVAVVNANPGITAAMLQSRVEGLNKNNATQIIAPLVDEGLIEERKGVRNSKQYYPAGLVTGDRE